ncbi:MAG: DUF4231 domain-containing protein [Oceanospirillaceae bacterium]|nr:DUF4231 domain-containing protein [Oceanospirillaceae bacterium]
MKNNEIKRPFYIHIQSAINRIEEKSDYYRNLYYLLRVSLIGLAALITIVSGWQIPDNNKLDFVNSILIFGALSAAITSIDTLLQIETKKNTYKLILTQLREIRSEVVYLYENNESDLDKAINDTLFPKYQTSMAYLKGLIGNDSDG